MTHFRKIQKHPGVSVLNIRGYQIALRVQTILEKMVDSFGLLALHGHGLSRPMAMPGIFGGRSWNCAGSLRFLRVKRVKLSF